MAAEQASWGLTHGRCTHGIYVGFEHVSTSTALLAILNAAKDKVAFCREWGIEIEPWQWHSRVFKRVKADNGELKSQKGFVALSDMEQTADPGNENDGRVSAVCVRH